MKTLRPASALRAEQESRHRASKASGHDVSMQRAIESIEAAQRKGLRSTSDLTYPDSVVEELRANGYTVTYHRACGAGDMDSHEISWERPARRR